MSKSKSENPIDEANKTPDEEFGNKYLGLQSDSPCSNGQPWSTWTHPGTKAQHIISLKSAARLTALELESCFELIEETSGEAYRTSSFGWHPGPKRKEMRLPDLRYLLVRKDGRTKQDTVERTEKNSSNHEDDHDTGDNEDERIEGFASMMPTWEDGLPVLYCYEIHLRSECRGTGLGKTLMDLLVTTAEKMESIEKVMLTCFVSNEAALGFYKKLGFETDEYSPRERRLRSGKVVVPDYVILSKRVQKEAEGSHVSDSVPKGKSIRR